jgi:DnaJ-class molecular chaperone
MPIHNAPGRFGDLIVTFHVVFPARLSEAQREGFRKLLSV